METVIIPVFPVYGRGDYFLGTCVCVRHAQNKIPSAVTEGGKCEFYETACERLLVETGDFRFQIFGRNIAGLQHIRIEIAFIKFLL